MLLSLALVFFVGAESILAVLGLTLFIPVISVILVFAATVLLSLALIKTGWLSVQALLRYLQLAR